MKIKLTKHQLKHKRIRFKIKGLSEKPRLSVFRSNRHLYAQIIDDINQKTLVASSTLELQKQKKIKPKTSKELAEYVGRSIAEKALQKSIKKVVFDRGGFKYAGSIKILADSARKAGLIF